ncbi:MAG: hypothetical protein HY066_03070 [Betaproteobacteria bacterium]|nr:hypothetical protein [Betaproteobacteria bacterium]
MLVALATLLPYSTALAGWTNGRSLFQNGPPGLGIACQDCHSLSSIANAANNPSLIANKIQFIQQMNIFSGRFSSADLADIAAYIASPNVDPTAISTTRAYNIPAPTNVDQAFIRIYNPSNTAGAVRATLYDQSGSLLGTAGSILVTSLAANSVTVVTATDIANAVGVSTWNARAWMKLDAEFTNIKAMNLIRSSLLISMSCLASDQAFYIPDPAASGEQAFIRLYNPSGTAGAVRGTLYSENGNVLGNANSILVSSLAANAVNVLNAADIAAAVGTTGWTGRAWLSLSSDFTGLRVMNTLRDLTTNTLVNVSCDASSTGTSADILNLPSPEAKTTSTVRIYNTSASPMTITGTLFDTNGTALGTAGVTLGNNLPAHSVLVLSNSAIANLFGVSAWGGRAWLQIASSTTGLKVLAMTKLNTLMEMSCTATDYAFNIPDASNAQDHPFIRLYNTGSGSGSVAGTLYDQSGNVLGTAGATLITSMPAHSVTEFTAAGLATAVGVSSWSGRAWLKLSTPLTGVKLLNILEDQVTGNWSNMSCVTN